MLAKNAKPTVPRRHDVGTLGAKRALRSGRWLACLSVPSVGQGHIAAEVAAPVPVRGLLRRSSRLTSSPIPGDSGLSQVLERFPDDRLAEMMLEAVPASEFA